MIARTWHGRVPAAKSDDDHEVLKRTGLTHHASAPAEAQEFLGAAARTDLEGRRR